MTIMEQVVTAANILVIDDDKDDLTFLNAILTEHGYLVRMSNSGALALASARALPPDLILLDILMPGMNGYEVCAALKADERLQDIPVLFLSMLGAVEDTVKAFECGGVDYVRKPVQPAELLARVNTHLLLRQTQKCLEERNAHLHQEIAEHQQTERALQESEKRLRSLLENSEDIIVMLDPQGHILYYNGPARYKIRPEEVIGKTPLELFAQEEAAEMMADIKQVMTTGATLNNESRLTWRGEHCWLSNILTPVRDEQGHITAVSVISRNITERKQAEQALKESEKRLRALIENSEDIIFMQDLEGRFLYYNGPAKYEITPEEILGKTPFDLFSPEKASEVMADLNQVITTGTAQIYERKLSLPWLHEFHWFSKVSSPVRDERGNIVGVSTISRNITERKHLEDQLRTALQEKELLLQEIHHRVKNNMQMMTSLCRLHAEKLSDDGAIGIFRELENKIASVASIHEMLYQSYNLTRIDMRAYLDDLIYRLFGSFEISSRKIMPRLETESVYFGLTTAMPCGLLINELVTNSFKYAFPGDRSGEVHVSLHQRDGHDEQSLPFELIVSDNGVGLPEDAARL